MAAGLLALLAAAAAAHQVAPEAIVAGVVDPRVRDAWGVDSAYRDEKAPRLLVIRVGPHWYDRTPAARQKQAAAWHDLWSQNVRQGILAVVDATTGTPVVHFGRGGKVTGVTNRPAP